MSEIECDVLVIGSGIGGCVSALTLADLGREVVVITGSSDPRDSNTGYAQGGIIYKGEDDSPALLVDDIIVAGAGATFPKAARILAEEGPRLVEELLIEKWKVPFSKNEAGILDLTMEGGHSISRIIHANDLTGAAIEEALVKAVQEHSRITIQTAHTVVDLITPSHHSPDPLTIYQDLECIGAYVFDGLNSEVKTYIAKVTVLTTGGLGRIYEHTTNPKRARGDGYAMAARAGARLVNMEYVQFHPTTLYHPHAERFLISESVRGEGAELICADGKPFMHKYHPQGALAPRDIVARAIHTELFERGDECVYLDLSASKMSASQIRERFPHIYETCLKYGIDATVEPIPVIPAAHYECGGVLIDEFGRTNIRRLFAVGEVSCTGLHGANRLASTSLLEGLVWGYRAANQPTTPTPKPITQINISTYTVQSGDTLSYIANQFNVSIEAIANANNISNVHSLQIGQTLTIPKAIVSTEATPTPSQTPVPTLSPTPTSTPTPPTISKPTPGPNIVYKVKSGDTLSSIATNYGTTVEAIVALNKITDINSLQIDQELVIPGKQ